MSSLPNPTPGSWTASHGRAGEMWLTPASKLPETDAPSEAAAMIEVIGRYHRGGDTGATAVAGLLDDVLRAPGCDRVRAGARS